MKKHAQLILFIFCTIFICSSYAQSLKFKNGSTLFAGGAGTLTDPYQITTCQQLQDISKNLSANYVLTSDIDCSDTKSWNDGQGFQPIANTFKVYFTGTLNGNNHKIYNLYVHPVYSSAEQRGTGLFGQVKGGSISNLMLVNANIIGIDNTCCKGLVGGIAGIADTQSQFVNDAVIGNITGKSSVGGLIGTNNVILSSSKDVKGGYPQKISNCFTEGNVVGNSWVGGLVGAAGGEISHSYSLSNVYGGNALIGGLAGISNANISDSFYDGKTIQGNAYVGGLVGSDNVAFNRGNISNSYSLGTIVGQSYVGGLIGSSGGGLIHVSNSYSAAYIQASDTYATGGLIGDLGGGTASVTSSYYDLNTTGQHDTGKGMPKTTAQMMRQTTFVGWDFSKTWNQTNYVDYPRLQWQTVPLKIAFLPIKTPQKVNNPFPITLVANHLFTGTVSLYSDRGEISPTYINMVNGQWSGNVMLYSLGENNHLFLRFYDETNHIDGIRDSNNFDVKYASYNLPPQATLRGTISDDQGKSIIGAKVQLYSGDPRKGGTPIDRDPVDTDARGDYELNDLVPGNFFIKVSAEKFEDKISEVKLAENRVITEDLNLILLKYSSKIPILLVPGVPGSNRTDNVLWYPRLPAESPAWNSGKLRLADPASQVGWKHLKAVLKSDQFGYTKGHTLFDIPYDWSLPVMKIRDDYFIPALENVWKKSNSKVVDIVAHSTGGLIVRSYLQSERYKTDKARGYKIRKFAMVGVPNAGAANAYYLWEGGDPVTADVCNHNNRIWLIPGNNFYTKTFNFFYMDKNKTFIPACAFIPDPDAPSKARWFCDTEELYKFIHEYGKSLKDLMPVYDDALQNSSRKNIPITREENTLVKGLNNMKCNTPTGICTNANGISYNFDNYKKILTTKVQAKLFVGTNENTIRTIFVGKGGHRYPDGKPISTNPVYDDGDGTVLKTSIMYGNYLPQTYKSSEHSALIKNFTNRIVEFLTGQRPKRNLMTEEETLTLVIQIDGRIQPKITSVTQSNGKHLKIDLANEQISNKLETSSVVLKQPSSGKYTVTLNSPFNEDYHLYILYYDPSTKAYAEINTIGYYDQSLQSFSFTLDNKNVDQPIVSDRSFGTPVGIEMQNNQGKIKLSWKDPVGAIAEDVDHYEIYWRTDSQPYYQFLDRTKGTEKTYQTQDDWSKANTNLYMIRAVLKNGKSTFFSQPTFYNPEN